MVVLLLMMTMVRVRVTKTTMMMPMTTMMTTMMMVMAMAMAMAMMMMMMMMMACCSPLKQIAGLDVGWSRLLDMEYNAATSRFELERDLLPGRYAYKFVWDDVWGFSADHPTFFDGTHTNNFLQV